MLEWAEHLPALFDERDLGLLTSVASLAYGLITENAAPCAPAAAAAPRAPRRIFDAAAAAAGGYDGRYNEVLPKAVRLLERLSYGKDVPADYVYYGVPAPWLQVKLLRIMSCFNLIGDARLASGVTALLAKILRDCAETAKSINKNNALHSVLFEALTVVMQMDSAALVGEAVAQLGRFIAAREPNTRYLGLANMGRLSILPDVNDAIRSQQRTIFDSLNVRPPPPPFALTYPLHAPLRTRAAHRPSSHAQHPRAPRAAGGRRRRTRTSASGGARWTCCSRCATARARKRSWASC